MDLPGRRSRREAAESAGPVLSPGHPRGSVGRGGEGHRPSFPEPRLPGQGDGRLYRQADDVADV